MLLAHKGVQSGGIRIELMGTNNTFPIGLEAYFTGRNSAGNISKVKSRWLEKLKKNKF